MPQKHPLRLIEAAFASYVSCGWHKIIIPASLPYVFTGYRLSLGLAWLVIVASEMLTGTPGVGGFLWQEYNSLVYSHIILSVATIGAIGFTLDQVMGLVEARIRAT